MNIPDGWKLVPVEPTERMKQALADETEYRIDKKLWKSAYHAMLAAAPTPPAQEPIGMEPVGIYRNDPATMTYGFKWLTDKKQREGMTYYSAEQLAQVQRDRDEYCRRWESLSILSEHDAALRKKVLLEAAKWQPIETAPKDGSEILLHCSGVLSDTGLCYWRNDHVMQGWTWGLGHAFKNPTHWMPLPTAPTELRRMAEEGETPHG